MKKTVLLLGIMLISFANFAQTNSKGVLKNNILKLNNGITLSQGDTIMLGEPVNQGNEFMFLYEPKHAFGLLGGKGANTSFNYRMLIIKFFTTSSYTGSSEKKFIASLGYNSGDDVILDCDIAEAIDNAEVIAKGRIPQKFHVTGKGFLRDVLQGLQEENKVTEKPAEPVFEKKVEKTIEPIVEKSVVYKTVETTSEKPVIKTNATSLLNRINDLQKAGYISNNEHYQLLKIITNSGNVDDKKELIKKLQTLRNENKLTIDEYDELVDLLL